MGPLARLTVLLAAVCPALVMSDTPANIPRISSISFSGNGCPAEPQWAGGFDNLMISYNQFNAKLPGEKANLNCQVHLQGTGGSPGWQVALRETWVQGHLVLAPGTKLDYWSSAFFSQDAGRTATKKGDFTNDRGYTINEDVTLYSDLSSGQVWSPCFGGDGYTGIFTVNWRGVLQGDNRASFEGRRHQWRLDWRRC